MIYGNAIVISTITVNKKVFNSHIKVLEKNPQSTSLHTKTLHISSVMSYIYKVNQYFMQNKVYREKSCMSTLPSRFQEQECDAITASQEK